HLRFSIGRRLRGANVPAGVLRPRRPWPGGRRNPEPWTNVARELRSDRIRRVSTTPTTVPMRSARVRRAMIAPGLAGALLLAGSALWQPAQAQYRGFGFPFFSNPWFFDRPAPEPRPQRRHQQRERE